MLVKTYGSAVFGIDAQTITIEIDIGKGASFYMVGLPDNAVRESQQRVETALKNNDFEPVRKRVIVNMAPADIKKEGSAYDLPIALGVLGATQRLSDEYFQDYIVMGELSLDGTLKPINGALPIAIQARKEGFQGLILPAENAREAAIVSDVAVYGIENMMEAVAFFEGTGNLEQIEVNTREEFYENLNNTSIDFADVKGQENIKRALEISAAGGHNLIMIGPPGSGKTMLAKRLPTIMPPFNLHEALETTKIHSVAGMMPSNASLISTRPFRSPHHTVSDVALVGGGGFPQPGEISLAHNGVLFLDELPEFKRTVLEVLRQPLEERRVTISRAKFTVDYPASFMLVSSMNPCPCGNYNNPDKECVCSPGMVKKYLDRISGPLMDRIDIHIEVVPVKFEELTTKQETETSAEVRERVVKAREIQEERFKASEGIFANAQMETNQVRKICIISQAGQNLLKSAMDKLNLSARAYDRILKVSRTIADLAGSENIEVEHLAEAIHYRSLDREDWAD
ncbi:MAG: magnesium chelatase [Bacteroidetes bacterium SW_10_40_5]|nr:MAG: magnesium chelatase [Bacteroidetes bacterium SW_10_40_5]